jgi:GT2 family glycosyltransferase
MSSLRTGPARLPPITVVISTRNRGERIVETIETILLNDHPDFEVRVVDQSDGTATDASLQRFRNDPRLLYVRTTSRGLSAGRNLGIRDARNELVAITDDDCRVPADWLRRLAGAFAVDPRIGVVFGNVYPGPHDPSRGFIISYVRKEALLARSILDKHRCEGIASCMGVRKSAWRSLGGFDELLGAGAPFRAAEEMDLAIRALMAGYYVYESPAFSVSHLGIRSWGQGRDLVSGYLFGNGAAFAKHLRYRPGSILFVLLRLAGRWAFDRPRIDFARCPPRWLRLRAFARGLMAGAVLPVDPATGLFSLPDEDRRSAASGASREGAGLDTENLGGAGSHPPDATT